MRSWIFRHRHRLRIVYGLPPAVDPRQGKIERRGRFTVLKPMPRRVA